MNFSADSVGYLNEPAARQRLEILKCRTELESYLFSFGIILVPMSAMLLMYATVGFSSRGRSYPPNPGLLPLAIGALVLAALGLLSRLFFRNCFLLDPERRCLIHQSQFLWFRRIHLILDTDQAVGVATEGRKVSTRYGSYWAYRTVVVGTDGRKVPVSNWRKGALEESNGLTGKIAQQLGCRAYQSPAETNLDVQMEHGTVIIGFGEIRSGFNREKLIRLAIVLVTVIVYFWVMWRAVRIRH